jgi:hypothetical protein
MNASHALFFAAVLTFGGIALAHPEPDIPVRGHFQKDGTCIVTVEFDPRCFSKTPITEPYVLKKDLDAYTPEKRQELITKASDAALKWVALKFEPSGFVTPSFTFEFTTLNEAPFAKDDDPVMIHGTWKTTIPAGSTGWRVRATKETPFALIFRNFLDGVEQPKFNVLFPGETSFVQSLTELK